MADIRDDQPQAPKLPPKVVKYKRPDMSLVDSKAVIRLVQSDVMIGNVQIIKEGGDNNLHSHAGMDGFWFVIRGQARFYGTLEEQIIADIGAGEAVFIPRNYPYWFERIGDEDLEILQIEAIDRSVRNTRTDHKPLKHSGSASSTFGMDGKLLSTSGLTREPGAT